MRNRHEDTKTVRCCAIYTRKSSEEGLEQDFNSLDAQREACAAFILSQQHEGWRALPEIYDDGGKSGATLLRPALQRLLTDITRHRIDIVVVYKVDRLTRSLADFAKLVEVFDGHQVSFVSITQQFNTTTSMGRLTLNVLLSFAQFEREVTAERIRDKIAASKRRGLWMGGLPPLGYDCRDRTLIVNAPEAVTVRFLYQRYLELGSVADLKSDVEARGILSKRRAGHGGMPMQRGALYRLLSNPLYRGQIAHKDQVYPGQHPAIIDDPLWQAVQSRLMQSRVDSAVRPKAAHASLLTGLAFDGQGDRLTPSHAVKDNKRYRYYLSRPLTIASKAAPKDSLRLPALELEREVTRQLCRQLRERQILGEHLMIDQPSASTLKARLETLDTLATHWPDFPAAHRRALVLALLLRVVVTQDQLTLHLDLNAVRAIAEQQPLRDVLQQRQDIAPNPLDTLTVATPIRLCHVRGGLKLVLGEGRQDEPQPDATLIKLLKNAHAYLARVMNAELGMSMKALAAQAQISESTFTAVLRLAWLAPDITQALMEGRHPPELNASHLIKQSRHLPLEWTQQRLLLKLTRATSPPPDRSIPQ